jgi:crossover junction endodeoxyribonuclease RuvC
MRLAAIHAGIVAVIESHRPTRVVVEKVFVAASPRAALVLGQARGVVLAAAAAAGLQVEELSPQAVKLAVVGTGAAQKLQVQRMVQRLLALEERPAQDAADALAAALCAAQQSPRLTLAVSELGAARAAPRATASRVSRAGRFVLRRIR